MNQVGKSKDKATEADAVERVQIEVLGSYGIDGKIDIDQLNENLKNINGLTYNGSELSDSNKIANLPATVTVNGYDIVINSNGGIEKNQGIIAGIIANPTSYYGKKVTNYKNDGNTYRIFYVDKDNYFGDGANTIYLKADYSSTTYTLDDYASYDATNTKVRAMNPLWAAKRGESSWNENEKSAAYLCSPVNADNYTTTTSLPWNGYYNSENANYVIGGPSVEMYVKSYNQAYEGITDSNVYTLGVTYRSINAPGYIYTLNGAQSAISNSDYSTGDDSLDYTRYNSMYCGKDGSKTGSWWLASPSAYNCNYLCIVGGNYPQLYAYFFDFAVSPLVSLKSSFIPEVEE